MSLNATVCILFFSYFVNNVCHRLCSIFVCLFVLYLSLLISCDFE